MPAQKRSLENQDSQPTEHQQQQQRQQQLQQHEQPDQDSEGSPSSGGEKDEFVLVKLSDIRKEVQCPICLGIIRKTRTVMECLHRFCRECIDKSMRLGNNECPACRTHCASRRSLRDDPNYDALIAAIYPDIDKYEEEELAFHEEEKNRNKLIQASIAQTLRRQSEALGRRRTTVKATAAAFVRKAQGSFRHGTHTQQNSGSYLRGKSKSGGPTVAAAAAASSNDDDDNMEGGAKDSSSAAATADDDDDNNDDDDEPSSLLVDVRQQKRCKKRWGNTTPRFSPSASAAASNANNNNNNNTDDAGGCNKNFEDDDNDGSIMEMTRGSRGISPGGGHGNRDVLVWGKGGIRSNTRYGGSSGCVGGANSKNRGNSRIVKLLDYLHDRSLEENNDNEFDIHFTLRPWDEENTQSLRQPYICCRPTVSVAHLCQLIAPQISMQAEELELLVRKPKSTIRAILGSDLNPSTSTDRSPRSQHDPPKEDELEMLGGGETIAKIHAYAATRRGELVLVYRSKAAS